MIDVTKIEISVEEVMDIMFKVQKYNSMRTLKLILEEEPNKIFEFGFSESQFESVEKEFLKCDKICREWWGKICLKYNIPEESKFRVDYETCTLTVM